MPVQPGPTPPLVVAQAQLLFAILMKALDHPAAMRQPQLLTQGASIEAPGEVPFGVPRRARQRTLPDQPAARPRMLAVRSVDPNPAGEPLARLALLIEHGDTPPPATGDLLNHGLRG